VDAMSVSSVSSTMASAGNIPDGVRDPLPRSGPLTSSADKEKRADTGTRDRSDNKPEKPAAIQIAKDKYLSIQFDKESNRYVFMSIEKLTGKVLEQYPAEDALRQIAFFRDITGLTLDTGA
jgi:uncharacterized FlaG/YvyC family protein